MCVCEECVCVCVKSECVGGGRVMELIPISTFYESLERDLSNEVFTLMAILSFQKFTKING